MKSFFESLYINRNKIILVIIDILIIVFAVFFAHFLFIDEHSIRNVNFNVLLNSVVLYIVVYEVFLNIAGIYRSITRYETGNDYLIYAVFCALASLTTSIFSAIFKNQFLNLKENILAFVVIVTAIISYHVAIRMIVMRYTERKNEKDQDSLGQPKNLLIIGAGSAARDIIRSLKEIARHKYNIVGVIDDNPSKIKLSISGVKILGDRNDIERIVKKYDIDEIFYTITRTSEEDRKAIINICYETGAAVRILPSTEDLIKNKNLLENMRSVQIEDLLGRDEIILDNNNIEKLIKGNVVLVTGGGGSIGSELCRQIVTYKPANLVILDIYENNLYDIQNELFRRYPNTHITTIVGSVRDEKKMEHIFKTYKPYLVFHAAAHKHVPLMEASPLEAIKNNVLGTKNVAKYADKYHARRFVLISTDKAVNPTSIMGASKRICEMIIQSMSQHSKTEFIAVRFGNVLGSNGSVIPLFKKQIAEGGPVTVVDKEITRYFMTIPEAISLILQATTYAKGGEIFVLDMGEPVKIYDLAVNLIKLSGLRPNVDIQIEITGLRPGEKLYEELLMSIDGLISTNHDKIFIEQPLAISSSEFEQSIDSLEKMSKDEGTALKRVHKVFAEVVPTYQNPDDDTNKKRKNQ